MFDNLSKDILAYMSPDEVAATVADIRALAQRLEDWNKQRSHWQEPAPRWPVVPPPRSQDDYGKIRVR